MEEKNIDIKTNSTSKGFNFHKVFAAIGLILIAAVVILSGVWYFVEGRNPQSVDEDDQIATQSAKVATKSATISATKSAN